MASKISVLFAILLLWSICSIVMSRPDVEPNNHSQHSHKVSYIERNVVYRPISNCFTNM